MKNLTLTVLFTLMTICSSFAINNVEDEKEVNTKLRNKIENLLGRNYQDGLEKNTEVSIKFIINRKGEIVILSVESQEVSLGNFIKGKLNYKETGIQNLKVLETYTMPIKFVKK